MNDMSPTRSLGGLDWCLTVIGGAGAGSPGAQMTVSLTGSLGQWY